MKKETELKYPHSANLFKFCRRVLDYKYGGIRVIDQDVGQILGFDPADCSHWKKGKKNIRSIQAMKNIAEHLGVEEKLVVDVASGEMNDVEAYFEFTGYGAFALDGKVVESFKKEFYRKYAGNWSKDKEIEFKNIFQIDATGIINSVRKIHDKIDFQESPLYLPEICSSYPNIILKPNEEWGEDISKKPIHMDFQKDKFVITYKSGLELKPFMRFKIAKAMASFFLPSKKHRDEDLQSFSRHVFDIESNIFASHLLAPTQLIRQEIKQCDTSRDIITQVAEAFWVSKAFINQRFKEILLENSI